MAKEIAPNVGAESTDGPEPRRVSSNRRKVTRRRVNGRFLLIFLGVVVLAGASTHFLHLSMVNRNSVAILDRAKSFEESGDHAKAISLYSQYRKFHPEDIEATMALAGLLQRESDSRATWRQVYDLLESVLRQDPERIEVRRPLVDASIQLRQFADADVHLESLMAEQKSGKFDPELVMLKGEVQEGLRRFEQAADSYMLVIDHDRTNVPAYTALVNVLRHNPDVIRSLMTKRSRSDESPRVSLPELLPDVKLGANFDEIGPQIVNLMVQEGRPSWSALLERARFLQSTGDAKVAVADVRKALEDPEAKQSADAVLTAAQIELAATEQAADAESIRAHRKAARELSEHGIAAKLPEPRLYLILSETRLAETGNVANADLDAAIELLSTGVAEAEKLRETARGDEVRRALEAEIEMRWYLANYRLQAALAQPELTESAIKSAKEEMATLQALGGRRELADFLAVRIEILQREWPKAAQNLENLRLRVTDMPSVRRRVDGMLAATFHQLENPEQQVEVFRRAIVDDPLWMSARIGLAAALVEAGRHEEALKNYMTLLDVPGVADRVAELLAASEMHKADSSRNFKQVREFLAKAREKSPDNVHLALLEADLLVASGDFAAAESMLRDHAQRFADRPEIFQALVRFSARRADQGREERLQATQAVVDAGKQKFGESVVVRTAQAELAMLRNDGDVEEQLRTLAQPPESFSPAEKLNLLNQFIALAQRGGHSKLAMSLWREVVVQEPASLAAWLRVAEHAIDANDHKVVDEALAKIRELEGPGGPNGNFLTAYARVMQIANDAALRSDPAKLAEALAQPRQLLQQAAERRAYWPVVPRAQGALESIAGQEQKAIQFLERAWQLGDRSQAVVGTLVSYYRSKNDLARAEQILRQLQQDGGTLTGANADQLAWQLRVEQGDLDGALEIVRRSVASTGGVREQITLASLLLAKYQATPADRRSRRLTETTLDEARTIFNKLVESEPNSVAVQVAYVKFLAQFDDVEEARKAVKQAEVHLADVPVTERLMGLAQCYTTVGQIDEAVLLLQEAIENDPSNHELRMTIADYLSRAGKLDDARAHVEWLTNPANNAPSEVVDWGKRRSAFILAASRGRHDDVLKAIEMLRGDVESGQASVEDLRAQVALLAGRGTSRDRRMMLEILESIEGQAGVSPQEKLQMVALYESTSQWNLARKKLEELRAQDGMNPQYLSAYIAGRARHEPPTDAAKAELEPLVKQLESLEPNSLRAALARAEFEKSYGSAENAGIVLTGFADTVGSNEETSGAAMPLENRLQLASAAKAAEELGSDEVALTLFRRLADTSGHVDDSLPLITHLARISRYDEALTRLEKIQDEIPPEALAVTAVNVVSLGTPSDKEIQRAVVLVHKAVGKSSQSVRIRAAEAGLLAVQGKYDDAEKLYRLIVKNQPNNAAALNNLAWLLMISSKDLEEASTLVNEAIAIAGPVADLVDTRGVIDLARGRTQEARDSLQEAFDSAPNANVGFHLAIALERLGEKEQAQEVFKEAKELGLSLSRLHPTEHAAYNNLASRFDGK